MKKILIISFLFIAFSYESKCQSTSKLKPEDEETIVYETMIFKDVRLINGYTSELVGKDALVFTISHRFGKVNTGFYELFGLDNSTIRFGFQYGLTSRIDLGFGRSSYEKLFDGFVKVKLLKQSTGARKMPFTVTLLEGMALKTLKWPDNGIEYPFTARLFYVHEIFISRKFNEKLTLQMVPVVVHRNLVSKRTDQNIVPAVGFGGMYKLTEKFTLIGEYYYLFSGQTADDYENALSVGLEIETSGHVFQLDLSNSPGMTEKQFIPETAGKWLEGDIHFGFNVVRYF